MTASPRILIVFWLAALVGAFVLGKATGSAGSGPLPQPPGSGRGGAADGPVPAAGQLLRLSDLLAATGGFSRAITELESSDEYRALFEELLPSFGEARTHEAMFLLADSWAAKDPEGACTWINGLEFDDRRNPYLFSALGQWARQDPEAVLGWLDSHHADAGAGRDYLLAGVVRGAAGADPELALRLLLAAPDSPERDGSIDFLVRAWRRGGLDEAFARVAALPAAEVRLKQRAIQQLVASLSPEELESARTWASGLPSVSDRSSAQVAVAAGWSRWDPAAAVGWANDLDLAVRSRAYGEIATRWARVDPLAAAQWLDRQAGKADHDLAARAVAWSTVGIDPDRAFAQIAGITHASLRDETFEQVGRFWLSEQPQRARELIEGDSPIPSSICERLLDSFE